MKIIPYLEKIIQIYDTVKFNVRKVFEKIKCLVLLKIIGMNGTNGNIMEAEN